MLLLITRLDLMNKEKPIVINTSDILSIEPEEDEAWVITSKDSFPISKETYEVLINTGVIRRLGDLLEGQKQWRDTNGV